MATEYLKHAIEKLNQELNHDALNLLKVAEYHAAEGFHMASTFKAALKCVQIRMTTKTLIESALQIKGHLYFFIHTRRGGRFGSC